jgi:uncharacterized coiled-coil DUF342 family protein
MEQNVQQEILERLVRLETKLDNYNGLREKINEAHNTANNCERTIEKLEKKVDDLSKEVNDIQKEPANDWKLYKVTGIAAVITAIIGYACGKIF